jgi:hypothetical protein
MFLIFLLAMGGTGTVHIRIQEAPKLTDPTDPEQ